MQVFRLEESFDAHSILQAKALEYEDGTRLDIKNEVKVWHENGKFRSWQRIMALIGPAGYGKSVLMAKLAVDGDVTSAVKERLTVGATHFFKHDDVNASSVRVCILSIANQLAVSVPGVKEELLKLNQSEIESITDLKVLFRSLLCAPMMRVKTPQHPIVVLMDALDEANVDEKGELVEIITTMWESETPQWLGVIVSSRPGDLVKDKFENTHLLDLDSEENHEDLNLFLQKQLDRHMKSEENVEKAARIMTERCDGLFLFAGFLIDKMLREREEGSLTLRDVRALVEEFPPGLEVVYRKYFTRFLQGPLENNYDQYQSLLSSMVVARSPLDVEIIAALLELKSENLEAFLSRAEHLLIVEHGKIRFVHESMRDFLQSRRRAGRVPDGQLPLSVTLDMGHQQLVEVLQADPLSSFAKEHLIYHLCKRKDWESVRKYLLDFDWVHAAVSMPGVAKRLVDDTDVLFNYKSFSDINVTDVIRAIEIGRKYIQRDPDSLAFQLFGRIADRSHPVLISLAASEFAKKSSVYVPIRATLEPARSPLRKIFEGHCRFVSAVAVDGDIVVSGSDDYTVRVWDRQSGECLQVLDCHTCVNAVSIDGDIVASSSEDKTIRLWNRMSGECLRVLEGHSSSVFAVAIGGVHVVSGSLDKTVRLWDRRSGECLQVLRGHFDFVCAVAIDGDTVVSGSDDKTVRLWHRESGECFKVLEGHSDRVNSVAIDGDIVVSASSDTTVRLWSRLSGECLRVLEGHSDKVKAVAIDGDIVVSGSLDTTVRLWERRTGECLRVLEGHFDGVNAVAIDENAVASGSWDETVRLWDRRASECVQVLEGHFDEIIAGVIVGDTVVSTSGDNTVRLRDQRSGKCLQVLEGHSDDVKAVAMDGDIVVSGSHDKTVRLWDRRSGECLLVLEGHSRTVKAVAIDGETVVSGSFDKSVRIWDRQSGECLQVLEGHFSEVFAVAIDGDTIVSGSGDKTVRLWDRRSSECLQLLDGHCSSVLAVAIDGDTVVSGSWDKTVRLWDRLSAECLQLLKGHFSPVEAVGVDGKTVVSCSSNKTVRLWDQQSGECLQVLLFNKQVIGVGVKIVEGSSWISVLNTNSKVPHILAPRFLTNHSIT